MRFIICNLSSIDPMKPALLALLILVSVSIGQNVLVSFYSNNPAYPNGWPRAKRETNNASLPAGWQTNMTVAQYQSYRSNLQASYDAIQASNKAVSDAALAAKIDSLQARFATVALHQAQWALGSNYSNAQMTGVITNLNATLQELKPFLKELYLQSLSQ